MIDDLLLKLYIMDLAEFSTDEIYGKSKEDFEEQLLEMSTSEKVELLESHGKQVDEKFDAGGRWTNWRTRVFRFWHGGDFVYVRVLEEVPATELQDSTDLSEPEIDQVWPHKVEKIVYTTEKSEKGRD